MMNIPQSPTLPIHSVIGCLSFFNADNLEIMRCFKDNEHSDKFKIKTETIKSFTRIML